MKTSGLSQARSLLRAITLAALVLLATACSHPTTKPVEPAPSDVAIAVPAEEPTPPPEETAPEPPPLPTLTGDDVLSEPWRSQFRQWLATQETGSYVSIVSADEISNSVTLVLRHRVERDGHCLEGPSRLTLLSDSAKADVEHLGTDCCPGTECTSTPESWNLRYLNRLGAQDWKALALLVPAKGKLTTNTTAIGSHVGPAKKTTRKLSRNDVAAGKFSDAPGCSFANATPSCGPMNDTGTEFTCKCDGGGYHVVYQWKKEGDGFVLTRIEEDSH